RSRELCSSCRRRPTGSGSSRRRPTGPGSKPSRRTPSIAGLLNEPTKEKLSFYQAMKKDLLSPETAVNLLEAQAATGFIIDPVKNERMPVDEAVKAGLVGPELHERLLSAERAVSGFRDPYTGKTVSVFEAMGKGLLKKDQGIRLLEAQLSTGGVIDPIISYRIPHEVACKRGYFDEEISKTLNQNTDDTKVFYDPNSQEDVTYGQLMSKCVTDKETGLPLLPLSKKAQKPKEDQQITEVKTKEALSETTMELEYGPFKGRKVTIWEIINSEYITEEQRIELIQQIASLQSRIWSLMKRNNENLLNECKASRSFLSWATFTLQIHKISSISSESTITRE
uniref:Uncharacterized protein n=1 Tax=Kryptolebias marmoratus TaxID=37003 RepID=A0A3Q2ZX38_KRYMA